MALEIVRRIVAGKWTTEVADVEAGGSLPAATEPKQVLRSNDELEPVFEFAVEETDQNVTLNRANDWTSAWFTLDAGAPAAIARWIPEVTAFVGDGETFGGDAGMVSVNAISEHSADGITWAEDNSLNISDLNSGAFSAKLVLTLRHRRFRFLLRDNDTGELYAGANDPVATCTLYAALS